MSLAISSLLLLAFQDAAGHRVAAGSISQAIFSEADDAIGGQLCDRPLREQLKRNFDRRYGKRVERLQREYQAMHGSDPGYDIILQCNKARNSAKEVAKARKALDAFEPKLRALELHVQSGGTVEPSEPEPARNDPWATQTGGLERASQAIEQCLISAGKGPNVPALTCIRAAYSACEDEHGTSQRQLNECSSFSYQAWKARIADTIALIATAKATTTRFGSRAKEAKLQLIESQKRWNEWNEVDCKLQAIGTEGGSIRPYAISICLSDHAAQRAIDLQRLIE
jgi:uncharacterized protein YecT (DUF1311 family)